MCLASLVKGQDTLLPGASSWPTGQTGVLGPGGADLLCGGSTGLWGQLSDRALPPTAGAASRHHARPQSVSECKC